MYESLPLGEVDSRVGHIARHEKDKGKNEAGTEQEDSEVKISMHASKFMVRHMQSAALIPTYWTLCCNMRSIISRI